ASRRGSERRTGLFILERANPPQGGDAKPWAPPPLPLPPPVGEGWGWGGRQVAEGMSGPARAWGTTAPCRPGTRPAYFLFPEERTLEPFSPAPAQAARPHAGVGPASNPTGRGRTL